jgi:hypothetical protein
MSDRHPLLKTWCEVGAELGFVLPAETFERLLLALRAVARAELGDAVEAVQALHDVAANGRADLDIDELLALVESRVREARIHAARLSNRVDRTIL